MDNQFITSFFFHTAFFFLFLCCVTRKNARVISRNACANGEIDLGFRTDMSLVTTNPRLIHLLAHPTHILFLILRDAEEER